MEMYKAPVHFSPQNSPTGVGEHERLGSINRVGLDTNISKKALNFFLEILIKMPKFLQNLL